MSLAALLSAAAAAAPMTAVQDSYPALSPDGAAIVFQSTRSGRSALYLADADGRNIRLLIDSGDDPATPAWSPDGGAIAFAATVDGQSDIFVIAADGTGRRRLTDDPGDDSHPHWSADGRIFFNSPRATPDRTAEWSKQHHDVYSMTPDGSDLRRHTDCRSVCTFPSPSPDGRFLAFRKVIDGPGRQWDQSEARRNSEVFVKDLASGAERNLSRDPAFDGWPVWSPDSRWVAFASNRGGAPLVGQIYAVRPEGGPIVQITDDSWSNVQPSLSPDGKFVYTYRLMESAGGEFGFIARAPFAPQ
jgi:Tol biopolymer transport system component